jgi:hypothetical protein
MIDICVSEQIHLRKTKHPVRLRFVQFLKTLAQARAIIQHKIVAMMSLQLSCPFWHSLSVYLSPLPLMCD